MSKIDQTDPNFKVETNLNIPDLVYRDALSEQFAIYGVHYENGMFRRMPEAVAKSVNNGVYALHTNTAGGRIRLRTNSPYVAIKVTTDSPNFAPHQTAINCAGFDIYKVIDGKEVFVKPFIPALNSASTYEYAVRFDEFDGEMADYVINMPTYGNVCRLWIGLSENAEILPPSKYRIEKPIVYYGSSITQGACASRPGNAYQAHISRDLDCNFINLGFSGSAKGEQAMAQYIASLDASVFVCDYDYNAPSAEHLLATHKPFYETIRKAHPTLPIVFLTIPKTNLLSDMKKRQQIIRDTYEYAFKSGDKNVYFLSGEALMSIAGEDGTVDACHPNDLGFFSMGKMLGDLLGKIV